MFNKFLLTFSLSCGLVLTPAYFFGSGLVKIPARASAGAAQERTDEQQLIKLTQDFAGYSLRSDTVALNNLFSDDFKFTHASGMVQPKVAYLKTLKEGTRRYEKFDLENVEVTLYGTTAITRGHLHIRNVNAGQPPHDFENQYLFVWIKQQDEWKMVALQLTPIGEIKIGSLLDSSGVTEHFFVARGAISIPQG